MNGVELSQELQNMDPNLLYKFITAADKEYIDNLKLNNPDQKRISYIKPLWLNEIRTTIHSLLYNTDQ